MLNTGALDIWKRQAHGPRIQAKAINYIASKMLIYEVYADMMNDVMSTLVDILEDCNVFYTPDESVRTL